VSACIVFLYAAILFVHFTGSGKNFLVLDPHRYPPCYFVQSCEIALLHVNSMFLLVFAEAAKALSAFKNYV
jgi:hypothetical protein